MLDHCSRKPLFILPVNVLIGTLLIVLSLYSVPKKHNLIGVPGGLRLAPLDLLFPRLCGVHCHNAEISIRILALLISLPNGYENLHEPLHSGDRTATYFAIRWVTTLYVRYTICSYFALEAVQFALMTTCVLGRHQPQLLIKQWISLHGHYERRSISPLSAKPAQGHPSLQQDSCRLHGLAFVLCACDVFQRLPLGQEHPS